MKYHAQKGPDYRVRAFRFFDRKTSTVVVLVPYLSTEKVSVVVFVVVPLLPVIVIG